ncbi:DUF3348 domain-containing protein [Luteibacter sp. PPL554]
MVQASLRPSVRGSTFVRLLARLTDADPAPVGGSVSDRLGLWLDWKQAIGLSSALEGKLPEPVEGVGAFDAAVEAECAQARVTLVEAIEAERGREMPPGADVAAFRARYLRHQRAIQAATGSLRGRLRDLLAAGSPEAARLAEVDAFMESTLSPREHRLMAGVPTLLGDRFERLRAGAAEGDLAWLDIFRRDMQDVLLAELDVRFQPVEGLLAALRGING